MAEGRDVWMNGKIKWQRQEAVAVAEGRGQRQEAVAGGRDECMIAWMNGKN